MAVSSVVQGGSRVAIREYRDSDAQVVGRLIADTFSQFNMLQDNNQIFYFKTMGGGTEEQWSEQMLASVDQIISDAPTFRAFVTEGTEHCVIPYDRFYTTEVNGKRLVDWLGELVAGKPVETQRCAACVPVP